MTELYLFLVGFYLVFGGIFIIFLIMLGFNVIFDNEKRNHDRRKKKI